MYNENVIKALAWLRSGWDGDNSVKAIEAFNTLDNAGVFMALDEQSDYAEPGVILSNRLRETGTESRYRTWARASLDANDDAAMKRLARQAHGKIDETSD